MTVIKAGRQSGLTGRVSGLRRRRGYPTRSSSIGYFASALARNAHPRADWNAEQPSCTARDVERTAGVRQVVLLTTSSGST
jgi:hypothetical protein